MKQRSQVSWTLLADEQLLDRFKTGQVEAFGELFRRYRLVAYRVAYRLLNHQEDALDAVQDGFVKALRNIPDFRGQSSFKTWLLRVVSNAALDLGRQRQRRQRRATPLQDDLDLPDGEFLPAVLMDHQELASQVAAAVAKLPEAQRETFVLHVDGKLSYREVAELLGVSIGTVMSRLFYARQKLKEFLTDQVMT